MTLGKPITNKTEGVSLSIRTATEINAADIAIVLRVARQHSLPYLPKLHTPEEDLEYIKEKILKEDQIVVADDFGRVIGFCAFKDGWIDHLYILPEYQGKGIGTSLLNYAKGCNSKLELWTFQRNINAIKFYQRHGFVLEETTDGSSNEEKEPDARYVWKKNYSK